MRSITKTGMVSKHWDIRLQNIGGLKGNFENNTGIPVQINSMERMTGGKGIASECESRASSANGAKTVGGMVTA